MKLGLCRVKGTFLYLLSGWMGGWVVIKRVFRFSLFFNMLKIMYICTDISTQKLSPRFLWVSKFDVKFGSGGHEFRKYGR